MSFVKKLFKKKDKKKDKDNLVTFVSSQNSSE